MTETTSAAPKGGIRAAEHHTCRNCGRKISPDLRPVGDRAPGSRWVHDIDGLRACPDGQIHD